MPTPAAELPWADGPPRERSDAARNRRRILDAAAEVFAGRPADAVTMDELAKAAGVGRATLYRRYPNVGAVAEALLDDHERAIQERVLRGPPPLGPGAPPSERLAAFFEAMAGLLEQHANLVLGAEVGRLRFQTGAYRFWSAHVRHLLTETGAPDAETWADLLLGLLDPSLYLHLRHGGVDSHRIEVALRDLARAATTRTPT